MMMNQNRTLLNHLNLIRNTVYIIKIINKKKKKKKKEKKKEKKKKKKIEMNE